MANEIPENILRDAVLLLLCIDNNCLGRETISFVKFLGEAASTYRTRHGNSENILLAGGGLPSSVATQFYLVTRKNPFRLSPNSKSVEFDHLGHLIVKKSVVLNSHSVMDSSNKHFLSTYYAPAIALETYIWIRFVISCL